MKCSIMLHFIWVYTVCKGKKYLQRKNTIFFENYNLTPLDMYNGLSQQNSEKGSGLYSKHVPIVPVLVELWSGLVNFGPWWPDRASYKKHK